MPPTWWFGLVAWGFEPLTLPKYKIDPPEPPHQSKPPTGGKLMPWSIDTCSPSLRCARGKRHRSQDRPTAEEDRRARSAHFGKLLLPDPMGVAFVRVQPFEAEVEATWLQTASFGSPNWEARGARATPKKTGAPKTPGVKRDQSPGVASLAPATSEQEHQPW